MRIASAHAEFPARTVTCSSLECQCGGQFEDAADWAIKVAARPNARMHIQAIAAHCLALAGRFEEVRAFAASINRTLPQYRVDDFLAAFRSSPDAAALFRKGAKRIGIA